MSDRGRPDVAANDLDPEEYLDRDQMEEAIKVDTKASSEALVENKKREFKKIRDDLMKSKRAVKVLHGTELQKVSSIHSLRQSFFFPSFFFLKKTYMLYQTPIFLVSFDFIPSKSGLCIDFNLKFRPKTNLFTIVH